MVQYVINLQEKFAAMKEFKLENETQAKEDMRQQYDKNTIAVEYQVGQSVWLMEPDSKTKMKGKWKGPFLVKKKLSPISYLIDMNGRHESPMSTS